VAFRTRAKDESVRLRWSTMFKVIVNKNRIDGRTNPKDCYRALAITAGELGGPSGQQNPTPFPQRHDFNGRYASCEGIGTMPGADSAP
jgi:hypothetical protein